jgi:hypothetical protein
MGDIHATDSRFSPGRTDRLADQIRYIDKLFLFMRLDGENIYFSSP